MLTSTQGGISSVVMQLAALDILTTKGRFTPETARAIGEAVDLQIESSRTGWATSQQLSDAVDALRGDFRALEGTFHVLEDKFHALETGFHVLRGEFHALEQRVKAEIAALDAKLEKTKYEILRWFFVIAAGQLLTTVMLRLLLPHGL